MKKRILILSLIILLLAILGYICIVYGIDCFFQKTFHIYCPGCGVTRMLRALLQLDFYQAFRYNELMFILFPFIIILLIYVAYNYVMGKEYKLLKKIPNWALIILVVIVILFAILRNIPIFDFLKPIEL